MTSPPPALSVIIASPSLFHLPPPALSAIRMQVQAAHTEVILAYAADADVPESVRLTYPAVNFLRVPQGSSLPRVLGAAMACATGEIVAVTDATCRVDSQWVSAILKSREIPHPVVGGAVEPEGLRSLTDWAAYFCDYGQFMLPLDEGVVREVSGNNLSFKRWALAKGRQYVEGAFWKSFWCRSLQADGLFLYATPSIVVYYRKSFRLLPYLAHRFHNGRCFAAMRSDHLSLSQRIMYLAGSPAIPLLFMFRITRAVLSKHRYRRQFVFTLPVIVLATVSWALGELCGYLLGPGTSCRHVR